MIRSLELLIPKIMKATELVFLARNIVRIHHGELIVTSHENQGTTVQLRFPNFYSTQNEENK
jgi:signal transduction histidine kinase